MEADWDVFVTRSKGKKLFGELCEDEQRKMDKFLWLVTRRGEKIKLRALNIPRCHLVLGVPSPMNRDCSNLGLQILHPCFLWGRRRSGYMSERLALISRRMEVLFVLEQ